MSQHICWITCPVCHCTCEIVRRYDCGVGWQRRVSAFGTRCGCVQNVADSIYHEGMTRRFQSLTTVTTDLPPDSYLYIQAATVLR